MNTFETALLTDLREHVAAQVAAEPTRARGVRRLRWSAVPAGAAAATAVALVLVQSPSAAYAVDTASDGDVVVTIEKLSDAAGLQKALRDEGINAEVDYDANLASEGPPPGAATEVAPDGGASSGPTFTTHDAPGTSYVPESSIKQPPCSAGPVRVAMTPDSVTFTISRKYVGSASTLHITTGGSQTGLSALQIGWDC